MVFILQKTTKLISTLFFVSLLVNAQTVNGYLLTNTYTDIDGSTIPFSIYEGKLLMVEAFASDCPACWSQHDEMKKLHQEYSTEIFMIGITIKTDETVATLTQYLIDFPTDWPVGFDDGFQLAQDFNLRSTPTMLLFNQEGRLLQQKVGFTPFAELSSMVSQYLLISNPQPSDSIDGYDDEGDSGSVIEDLFGSTLFRISFLSILVIMVYLKMTGPKTVA
ncbi:MAG: TlpA family protein disulfide reductase [Candidatus Heimdallarchaeota archaeon]|nr:TlpA family protein disulfide reductase [Candidatus Heimdallarchaeota archaeon]